MKKYIILLCAAAIAAFSCNKKEEPVAASLEVDKTELSAPAEGGNLSFNVTANCEWGVQASERWITLENAKGNGNGTVSFSVAENTSTKERTATVSVNSVSGKRNVKVTQAGQEIVGPSKIVAIKTAEDFAAFVDAMDSYSPTETVTLEADITIPEPAPLLACNFDGKNHTITMTHTASQADLTNIGVFREVKAAVKNLKTAGQINFTAEGAGELVVNVGGIAGAATEGASFENCVNGIEISATASATHHLGGIVGDTAPGVNLTGCTNKAKVSMDLGSASAKASQVGGIIGHLEGAGVITSCTNDGDVTYIGGGTTRMGGIVGYVNNLTEATFKDCTNNGAIANRAEGYTAAKWAYIGGITGYYGTPVVGSKVLYDGCVNNGTVSCDPAKTKLRIRIAGINAHAGNSNNDPVDGKGVFTWELKNCTNNGDVTLFNTSGDTRSQLGGIQAYGEPSGTVVIDGCTNNGKLSNEAGGANNSIGGMLGGTAALNSSFTNITVSSKSVITADATSHIGLIVGNSVAYTTAVTGKVGGTLVLDGATTAVTADNFAGYLFGGEALGEGGSSTGVTFAN